MMLRSFIDRASVITGVLFFLGLAFTTASCGEEKSGTPHWKSVTQTTDAPADEIKAGRSPAIPSANEDTFSRVSHGKGGMRFIAYNVENWLTMERSTGDQSQQELPKPEKEKRAVISLLVKHQPDVLGLAEIGTAADLAEIQQRLKKSGLDLPFLHDASGSDSVRRLGFLSRFPIVSTAKPLESEFRLEGRTYAINRGILDVTIRVSNKLYRFLGVHLKSKREVNEVDQELMRQHEARLLRLHVDEIFKKEPNSRLIVYGDFNDTRRSKSFSKVTGSYDDPGYLTAIPFRDSRGESWTHYWEMQDIYSRIDFVTVTRSLKSEVDFKGSYIIDDAGWNEASDHRPILAIFR